MTRADIEAMLQKLAATTRYLQDSGRRMREAAEHIAANSDHGQATLARIDAAILSHLHGDEA
jgi:hypothetical protein